MPDGPGTKSVADTEAGGGGGEDEIHNQFSPLYAYGLYVMIRWSRSCA